MHKILNLKRLAVLGVLALLLLAAGVAFAQEATAVPAEGEAATAEHSEAAPAAEGEHAAEGAAAEGEEAAGGIEALGLNAGYLLAQIVNFGIIFFALRALLWKPILNMLDTRTAKIEKGLETLRLLPMPARTPKWKPKASALALVPKLAS